MVGFKQWPRTGGTTRIGHFVFSSFNSYFESNELQSVFFLYSTAGGHRVWTGASFRAISGDDTAHSCWMEQVLETLRAVWDTAFWYVLILFFFQQQCVCACVTEWTEHIGNSNHNIIICVSNLLEELFLFGSELFRNYKLELGTTWWMEMVECTCLMFLWPEIEYVPPKPYFWCLKPILHKFFMGFLSSPPAVWVPVVLSPGRYVLYISIHHIVLITSKIRHVKSQWVTHDFSIFSGLAVLSIYIL